MAGTLPVADRAASGEPSAGTRPPGRVEGRPHLASGMRAMAGWLPGMALYGLGVGVTAGQAGVPAFAGWLTAASIYSGGAHVATIELLDAGAAPLVVATVVVINARLVVYSERPHEAER